MERLELTVCSCIGANVLQLYLVADYEAKTFNYKQKLNTKQ